MRIAVAKKNFTIGAFEENFAKIEAAVAQARRENADLVVF